MFANHIHDLNAVQKVIERICLFVVKLDDSDKIYNSSIFLI